MLRLVFDKVSSRSILAANYFGLYLRSGNLQRILRLIVRLPKSVTLKTSVLNFDVLFMAKGFYEDTEFKIRETNYNFSHF